MLYIGGIYEFAVFQSIEEGDIEGFKRNYSTLNFYYNELRYFLVIISRDILPESSKKNSVIGLYLLYLLSQNEISEFHVELQSIPSADHNNIYINVPVSLEQYFVDGNYAKVLATKHAPLDVYNFFIKKFIDTVRTEIARSVEVSYKKLSIKDACEVFMLDDVDQLKEFVERESDINNSDRTISWVIKDDYLHFDTITIEKEGIPAKKMIFQVLDYAREL